MHAVMTARRPNNSGSGFVFGSDRLLEPFALHVRNAVEDGAFRCTISPVPRSHDHRSSSRSDRPNSSESTPWAPLRVR